MARPKQSVPSYRHHKPSGRARATVGGHDIWLGKWDSPESHEAYARLIADYNSIEHARAFQTPSPAAHYSPVPYFRRLGQCFRVRSSKPQWQFGHRSANASRAACSWASV